MRTCANGHTFDGGYLQCPVCGQPGGADAPNPAYPGAYPPAEYAPVYPGGQPPYGPPPGTPGAYPASGPYPPAPYGPAPYPYYPPYPVSRGTNGLAIASLVLGVLWIYWIGSILALVFGYVARRQIRQSGQDGGGLAIAGIVLGWVGIAVLAVLIVVLIGVANSPTSTSG